MSEYSGYSIEYRLEAAYHDDNPDYKTLSYVRGSAEGSGWMRCNGECMRIIEKFVCAFLHLWDEREEGVMRISKLCIKILDPNERGRHISLLDGSYSEASRSLGLAWDGRWKNTSHLVGNPNGKSPIKGQSFEFH